MVPEITPLLSLNKEFLLFREALLRAALLTFQMHLPLEVHQAQAIRKVCLPMQQQEVLLVKAMRILKS